MKLMSVYLTNLGKYNEGELVGEWLDLPTDKEEIDKAMKRIGVADNTEYEEYFITDDESDFGFTCPEYCNIYEINTQLQEIDFWKQKNSISDNAVKALVEADTKDLNIVANHLQAEDFYYWDNQSLEDVAYELLNERLMCIGLDQAQIEFVTKYIDYSIYADELESGSYTETSNGVIEY